MPSPRLKHGLVTLPYRQGACALAVILTLGACGGTTSNETTSAPWPVELGGNHTATCRDVATEVDRSANALPATTSSTSYAGGSDDLFDQLERQASSRTANASYLEAVGGWFDEVAVLADQHPSCFSVALRAQVETLYRRRHGHP